MHTWPNFLMCIYIPACLHSYLPTYLPTYLSKYMCMCTCTWLIFRDSLFWSLSDMLENSLPTRVHGWPLQARNPSIPPGTMQGNPGRQQRAHQPHSREEPVSRDSLNPLKPLALFPQTLRERLRLTCCPTLTHSSGRFGHASGQGPSGLKGNARGLAVGPILKAVKQCPCL